MTFVGMSVTFKGRRMTFVVVLDKFQKKTFVLEHKTSKFKGKTFDDVRGTFDDRWRTLGFKGRTSDDTGRPLVLWCMSVVLGVMATCAGWRRFSMKVWF